MHTTIRHWKILSLHSPFLWSLVFSTLLFCGSVVASQFAATFATARAGDAVPDLILTHLSVFPVDTIFIYATLLFEIAVLVFLLNRPGALPFALFSLALLYSIRAVFVCLTHLGPMTGSGAVGLIPGQSIATADYFFSGHTATPFLLALVFWDRWKEKIIFLSLSVFFGAIVLLGHLHYSIDVFAAPFMAYSIYVLAQKLFPTEYLWSLTKGKEFPASGSSVKYS